MICSVNREGQMNPVRRCLGHSIPQVKLYFLCNYLRYNSAPLGLIRLQAALSPRINA